VRIDMDGSSFGVVFNLYRAFGPGIGNLGFMGCAGFGGSMTLIAEPGSTYYIQAGSVSPGPAQLELHATPIPPPPNDALADARAIGPLPYSDTVNMISSTLEAGEPAPPGFSPFIGTAWYSFTAPESTSLLIGQIGCCGDTKVAVYTGSTVGSLDPVPVTRAFSNTIFEAVAGTTYLLQLGHNGISSGSSGMLGINIDRTPPPNVSAFWSPFDPSSYDPVQFFANGFDPAGIGIESWEWEFGDGRTASGPSASHRYFADGDYDVRLTARTPDGRSASSVRTLSVRTHDVAISKLVVPQAASAGQTRSITVTVVANRYDESVTLQLYRSVPGGFAHIGSSTQWVQVRKRGTTYAFSYTFTAEDAALMKMTFKAVATINGARDALPADNEVVSLPTKLS
jgi:PKD repeat protein